MFRFFTRTVLLAFSLIIILLIIADIVYVDWNAFKETLTSSDVRNALVLSFASSILSTVLCVGVAIPSAYALSKYKFKGSIIFDTMIDLLIVLPVLVIGISILIAFKLGSDLRGSSVFFIQWLGYGLEYLSEFFIYKKPGVVLAQFFCAVPFAIRIMKATFDGIDPRKEQVALTLGCTQAESFRRVTLPLAKPGILAGALLSWAMAFGVFGAVIIVGGSIRGQTEILPTAIYLEVSVGNIKNALVVALIMLISATLVLIGVRSISGKSVFGT